MPPRIKRAGCRVGRVNRSIRDHLAEIKRRQFYRHEVAHVSAIRTVRQRFGRRRKFGQPGVVDTLEQRLLASSQRVRRAGERTGGTPR